MCDECDNKGYIEDTCGGCSGSGEGMYDGSTCDYCKGSGVEHNICDCEYGDDYKDLCDDNFDYSKYGSF